EWIASGTPEPKESDARIVRIEIMPSRVVLRPPATQQLNVRAHFSDGHSEDVTRWAKYSSANETVSQIDETGQLKVVGFGEGAGTQRDPGPAAISRRSRARPQTRSRKGPSPAPPAAISSMISCWKSYEA